MFLCVEVFSIERHSSIEAPLAGWLPLQLEGVRRMVAVRSVVRCPLLPPPLPSLAPPVVGIAATRGGPAVPAPVLSTNLVQQLPVVPLPPAARSKREREREVRMGVDGKKKGKIQGGPPLPVRERVVGVPDNPEHQVHLVHRGVAAQCVLVWVAPQRDAVVGLLHIRWVRAHVNAEDLVVVWQRPGGLLVAPIVPLELLLLPHELLQRPGPLGNRLVLLLGEPGLAVLAGLVR